MLRQTRVEATGRFTRLDGEEVFCITNYDAMPPFFMSLASDADLWMFITSNGGMTAGRANAEGSLFPYETVDKLHDAHHHTGPLTLVRAHTRQHRESLWVPFAPCSRFRVQRNLYKNRIANRLIFEETNLDLQLTLRCRWSSCESLGFVRTVTLVNEGDASLEISLLDGLRNILPFGAPLALYQQSSCLVDAYKHSERDAETQLGIYSLTAKIVDRAEAAEELRANTVWCHGLEPFTLRLSLESVESFRCGEALDNEDVLTGRRGNYFAAASFGLAGHAARSWHLVADVGLSHLRVEALRQRLRRRGNLHAEIEERLQEASENLRRNVASADGLQLSAQRATTFHHFSNVLFNNMRGGVFLHNDAVPTADCIDFLAKRNRSVERTHQELLVSLPATLSLAELHQAAAGTKNADFQRLVFEYLPLYFGRRHGDPSRPWNRFDIHLRHPDGSRALRYEGNWRDIFQNWEALAFSFPAFLPSFIAKFVNASTVDGFNPYRITRDGIDWEILDPRHPWNHIGYWGDHQIIYLLKLLESLHRMAPGTLRDLLQRPLFSYADVPYRLVPYEDILRDPHHTITYDSERAERVEARVRRIGSDGKLLHAADESIVHVNLLEKLLVPALSKLSSFVPGGGIWMNTQRPEWNDANNALVGHGISVVTLCALRRYLRFLGALLQESGEQHTTLSSEVAHWLEAVSAVLIDDRSLLEREDLPPSERKRIVDALGQSFAAYRRKVYVQGFSGKSSFAISRITTLCHQALAWIDHSIRSNRRPDGLYHAYNVLDADARQPEMRLRRLHPMLEGQVAALDSGFLEADESAQLLDSLFTSPLYRADQRSFMLYPARELPGFLSRNLVPASGLRAVPLLLELLEAGDDSLVGCDAGGTFRFHADFSNAADVSAALDRLAANPTWTHAVSRDRQAVLALFEQVFQHRAFTGRSGTMYGYEGLGCIYWHMVAKLLLAVQEIALRAIDEKQPAALQRRLVAHYRRIRAGLGFEKTPAEYGAFPTDPYSHTPAHAGAQQPGMTGQVKEEILTRFGELGVRIEAGAVHFRPILLQTAEFLLQPARFEYVDVAGASRHIELPAPALAFTFCQVPIVYRLIRGEANLRPYFRDGTSACLQGSRLDDDSSRALLVRSGTIVRIDVDVPESALFSA